MIPFFVHGAFEYLAYATAYWVYLRQRKLIADPYTANERTSLFLAAAIGGVIGAHALGICEVLNQVPSMSIFEISQQKTIVGGILGATLATEIAKYIRKRDQSTGDLLVVPIAVAIIIGRIGCHLVALHDGTYGSPTDGVFGYDHGDGILRHPTSLIEMFCVSIVVLVLSLTKRHIRPGDMYRYFMASYMGIRLGLDALKPSAVSFSYGTAHISVLQIAELIGALYFLFGTGIVASILSNRAQRS
ncbi:MAG TPA: prolipoprotein diacylglyceryl transferase family protein [Candidatus Didemnitutus sp.]|nr:prolipoprotein diacylglyceryl transferase family protein [Candidatus Didemnitutus sp.]